MKTLNVLLISGLVLLFSCGTALALPYKLADSGVKPPNEAGAVGSETGEPAHVPEPATILLLGSGLVALGIGVRKMKK
jgi:hypothetical protein